MTRRLFFALAGLAVVVLVLSDVIGRDQVVVAERRGAVIDLERQAFRVALAAQDDLEHEVADPEAAQIGGFVRRTAARVGAIAVVTDRAGNVVAAAPVGAKERASTLARVEAARALRRSTTASRSVRLAGDDYEVAEVPIVANQGIVGVVLLAQRSSVLDRAAGDRLAFLTPTLLVAVGLALVLALVLARALTRPLAQLVSATRRVAREGKGAPSVEPRGPAELRELADAFNAMSLRVRELIDRQSQFASDVSHQLRTPLTTLGVAVERTRERGAAGDIDGAGESLAAVQGEVTRLRELVEGLLVLTRVPLADAVRERVDVAAIAHERATLWRELAREHGVALVVRAAATADALAVPGAVDQILDNLLDNALDVAPTGSEIAIEVTAAGALVAVAVTDRGPGMPPADRARAFDRFWRADDEGSGIGIGLTIVRDLTEASGGEIELVPADGGGTRAVLRLEAAPGRGLDPVGVPGATSAAAMTTRLWARLRRYLRARDPERASAVEAEVWLECMGEGSRIDGCDECATAVFSMAHERIPDAPTAGPVAELDAHLLRTLGGLDTAQIAAVLEVTPRAVERLERRARRTLLPVVDGRLVAEPTPVRRVPRAARVGAIAAAAVVAATGTAAATGSLPDPVQHQVARVLRSVGVHVPDPDRNPAAPASRTGAGAPNDAATTAVRSGDTSTDPTPASVGPGAPAGTPALPAESATTDPPVTSGRAATAPGQAKAPGGPPATPAATAPGQAKKSGATSVTPPGQAKKSGATSVTPPGQAKKSGATSVTPPGQAKKSGATSVTPPGQAKKSGATSVTPPGQAKKSGATSVTPPGQAKKTGGAPSTPPGQAKKSGDPRQPQLDVVTAPGSHSCQSVIWSVEFAEADDLLEAGVVGRPSCCS